MNFFGHAAVATWHHAEPALATIALGSMLPDFASMAHLQLDVGALDADLAAGIALHHRTDAAFHPLPAAVGLMRELGDRLTHAGCSRGPMRAASHLGVELLLDGVLVDDAGYRAAYLAAIALTTPIALADDAGAARLAQLRARLRDHGIPRDLADPTTVTNRIVRAIAHRPRLAATSDEAAMIRAALAAMAPRVRVATDTILRGVRAALAPP